MLLNINNSWITVSLPLQIFVEFDKVSSVPMERFQYKRFMETHRRKHPNRKKYPWCIWCKGRNVITPVQFKIKQDHVDCMIPTGLHGRLMKVLVRHGIYPQVADLRQKPPRKNPLEDLGITLRDYQQEIYDAASKYDRGMWEAPGGSGKTFTMLAVAQTVERSLIIVPTRQIFTQFVKSYKDLTGEEVGLAGGGDWEIKDHNIAVLGMLHSRRDTTEYKRMMKDLQLIGFDEHHRSAAETWFAIAQDSDAYYRYGQSATIEGRSDRKDIWIEAVSGPLIKRITEERLIETGHLAEPDVRVIHIENCFREGMYHKAQEKNIFNNPYVDQSIQFLCELHKEDKIIILVTRIDFGEQMQDMLPKSRFVYSGSRDTKKLVKEFREGDLNILIASQLLDEGADFPEANVLIMPCGGKGEIRQKQRACRVLRPKKDRDNTGIVYDFAYHDKSLLQKHANRRISRYYGWNWKVRHYIIEFPRDAPVEEGRLVEVKR